MNKRKNLYLFGLAVAILFIVTLACGSSNEGEKISEPPEKSAQQEEVSDLDQETDEQDADEPEEIEPEDQADSDKPYEVYEVGDLIEVKDHTIRINSIEYNGTVLAANFTVENHGDSDLNVSSLMSFSAKKGDGTKLDQEIFDCGTSGLDGGVLPGDKLRGDICWSGANPDDDIQIYYESSLFSSGAVVWKAIEGEAKSADNDTESAPEIEVYEVGDLIEVKNHTIRLNSVEYQGTNLVTNFLIENNGDSDLDISSILLFSAKKGDGTTLEEAIFDCGPSSLDGKILPGDRLRGDICWEGANVDDDIKIYYEADMFGEGAVVWIAVEGDSDPNVESDAELKTDVFEAGDVVEIEDHTIVLNEVAINGNLLTANFTIENQGSTDVDVSSMLSFYAKKRDGTKLEQELFDCGTSLDGSIIPGDKLRGDICWSGASMEDGIKIYYESDLFGEGAVVWVVK